jgi:hypothetical protein
MAAQLPFERRKFVKWVRRYCQDNAELFESAAISLSILLERYGYEWVETGRDRAPTQVTNLEFNKVLSEVSYSEITVYFNPRGRLRFSVGFANRVLRDGYRPTLMGDFVRRQSNLQSDSLWGARWYHFDKKRKFLKDWRQLEETIPSIAKFLEDGTPHPNIYGGPTGRHLL